MKRNSQNNEKAVKASTVVGKKGEIEDVIFFKTTYGLSAVIKFKDGTNVYATPPMVKQLKCINDSELVNSWEELGFVKIVANDFQTKDGEDKTFYKLAVAD